MSILGALPLPLHGLGKRVEGLRRCEGESFRRGEPEAFSLQPLVSSNCHTVYMWSGGPQSDRHGWSTSIILL